MTRFAKLFAFAAAALTLSTAAAYADTITTTTWDASGHPDSDGNAAAEAVISIDHTTGLVTIQLSSLFVDPTGAGQAVSGIEIDFSNNVSNAHNFTQAGQLINVGGSPQKASNVAGNPTHWGDGISGGNLYIETAGTFAHSGTPIDMIVGAGNYNTDYKNLNSSYTQNHLPLINGTATFTLDLSGIYSGTDVDGVTFLFGTGPDGHLTGCKIPNATTPEPSSLFLLGTGILGAGMLVRRRMQLQPAKA